MNITNLKTNLKISKSQIKNLGNNIRSLMEKNKISEATIARSLNLPLMTIRRLTSGETTDPRITTLKLIANFFNVTLDSLIEDNEKKATTLMPKNMPQFVPVMDWDTVAKITTIKDVDLHSWKNWQSVTMLSQINISDCAFAIESKPAMQSRFPSGTIFIIEPNIKASDGDIVLIKIIKTGEIAMKELFIDPPEHQLHPIVPGTNIIAYSNEDHHLIGIVLLTLMYNRRILN